MSVYVMGWVWERYPAGGSEKLVALALADEADHDGDNIFPSVSRIARRCNMSDRGVQKLLRKIETRELAGVRWFELIAGDRGGRNITRRYRCPVGALKHAAARQETANAVHPLSADNAPGGTVETPNAVHPKTADADTKGRTPVHPTNPEQCSPFGEKGRTGVRKRVNASSPDPLLPVIQNSSAPMRARAREAPPAPASDTGLVYGEVVSILDAHGTPYHFCTSHADIACINAWADAGVTSADLAGALSRAHQRKRDGPIGPRYLDPIVKQFAAERRAPNTPGDNHGRRKTDSRYDTKAAAFARAVGDPWHD